MIDVIKNIRSVLLASGDVSALVGTNVFGGVLPEHYDPSSVVGTSGSVDGPAMVLSVRGGTVQQELPVQEVSIEVQAWAGVNDFVRAGQVYQAALRALHGYPGNDFGADGKVLSIVAESVGQNVVDPESGWATMVGFFKVIIADTGEVSIATPIAPTESAKDYIDELFSELPPGPKGDKGDKGDAGAAGADGALGAKGDKGDKGDTGTAGAAGAQGIQGVQGVKGDTGLQGVQGVKGDTGSAGADGTPGAKGDTGSTGAKGDKGDTGNTGPAGPSVVDTVTLDIANQDVVLSRASATTLGTPSQVVIGSAQNASLSTPATPTVTPTGGSGSTWGYKVTALDNLGETIASAAGTTAVGAATLDGSHYNVITWAAVTGAVSYNVYRITVATSPTTTGKIGSVAAGATRTLTDNGLAGGGQAAPTANTTGNASEAASCFGSIAGSGPCFWGGQGGGAGWVYDIGTAQCVVSATHPNAWLFYLPFAITIRKATISLGTKSGTAGATANFGIYDANLNLLIDSGNFAVGSAASAGIYTNTIAQTSVTLQPGWYWYVACCSVTDAKFDYEGWNTNAMQNGVFNKNMSRTANSSATVAAGANLPTTISGTLSAGTLNVLPLCLFEA